MDKIILKINVEGKIIVESNPENIEILIKDYRPEAVDKINADVKLDDNSMWYLEYSVL